MIQKIAILEYQADVDAQETDADMARSLFCVAAPGATQDTTRLFKAILKGCIPITFFRCAPCLPALPSVCTDKRVVAESI